MRCFEFTTGHDGQGRIKPIVGGTGHMFPGCASYNEFSGYLDALIAELDKTVRAEAQKYFAMKPPTLPRRKP